MGRACDAWDSGTIRIIFFSAGGWWPMVSLYQGAARRSNAKRWKTVRPSVTSLWWWKPKRSYTARSPGRPPSQSRRRKLRPQAGELAGAAEQRMRQPAALVVRVHGQLVQEEGGAVGDLRPEQRILRIEAEGADGRIAIERELVAAGAHVLGNGGFVHFAIAPQRPSLLRQALRGRRQHRRNARCFVGACRPDLHLGQSSPTRGAADSAATPRS